MTVCSGFNGKTPQDAWDTHKDNFRKLKNQLLPPLDRGVSALLDDLHQRGLAGAHAAGGHGRVRPHAADQRAGRPRSLAPLLLGAAVRRRRQAGPRLRAVRPHRRLPSAGRVFTPADMTATVYHCLGIDHHAEMRTRPAGRLPSAPANPWWNCSPDDCSAPSP